MKQKNLDEEEAYKAAAQARDGPQSQAARHRTPADRRYGFARLTAARRGVGLVRISVDGTRMVRRNTRISILDARTSQKIFGESGR
jgi:hypothetical protein